MNKLCSLFIISLLLTSMLSQTLAFAFPPGIDIPPTNAIQNLITSNGTFKSASWNDNVTLSGQNGITITSSQNQKTIFITGSGGGNGSGITSLNGQTGPAVNITGSNGNTITASGNVINIKATVYQNNTGSNLGTSGFGVFSSMSGSVLQFLKLISANSNLVLSSNSTNIIFTISNLVSKLVAGNGISLNATSGVVKITNTGVLSNNAGTGISINQTTGNTQISNTGVTSLTANSPLSRDVATGAVTVSCPTCGAGTITGSQNAGKATGSVGVLSTATSTTIKGRNFTGTSPITITKTNDTDVAVACSTCLTTAVTQLNTFTGKVNITRQFGNTTVTNSSGTIKIGFGQYAAVNNLNNNFSSTQSISGESSNFAFSTRVSSDTAGNSGQFSMSKSGGTQASKTATPSGSRLGIIGFGGYDGSAFTSSAAFILSQTAELFSTTAHGADMLFDTTNSTTTSAREVFRLPNYGGFRLLQTADPSSPTNGDTWLSTTNAAVYKYRSGGTTYDILSTKLSTTTSTPANGNGTTSTTTARMQGLAGALTPNVSSRVFISVCGQMSNSLINDGATVQLKYGTGSAPANGNVATGTSLGASQTMASLVAAQKSGFCVQGVATGLTLGTAIWVDVSLLATTAGTAKIFDVTVNAFET